MKKFQTIKIWKETHKVLRLIHAYTEESIVEIVHRLVSEELERVRK